MKSKIISKLGRKLFLWRQNRRIKHESRTILCNMCLGGVLYHDLGLRFDSPTINLMIPANEFVSLCENLCYIKEEICEIKSSKGYPIGRLGEKYTLHFIHYKSIDEAIQIWKRREKRVNYISPYIILVETASCRYEDLERFDRLPYSHKIALVHKEYAGISCARVIKGYDGKNLNGEILQFTSIWGTRRYDQIDWIQFLNLQQKK